MQRSVHDIRHIRLTAIFACILIVAQSYAEQQMRSVMVIGCENRIKDRTWKDYRISFGVSERIAQQLYDSRRFFLVESDAQMREKLREIHERLWKFGEKRALENVAVIHDSAHIVFGRLIYCGAPRTAISIGPMHANRNEVVIKTEVVLVTPNKTRYTGQGQGVASRTAMATLFEYRKDAVLLDQTAVGQALQKAIDAAVTDLVSRIEKELE